MFILFLSLYCWATIAYAVSHVALYIMDYLNSGKSIPESLRLTFMTYPTSVIVVFLSLVVGIFVTDLFRYHLKIICKS